jgi:hypothetical protein
MSLEKNRNLNNSYRSSGKKIPLNFSPENSYLKPVLNLDQDPFNIIILDDLLKVKKKM